MAWLMWITDHRADALTHADRAVEEARAEGHPLTLSYTLFIETVLPRLLPRRVRRRAVRRTTARGSARRRRPRPGHRSADTRTVRRE
jgi:hypothetical protein